MTNPYPLPFDWLIALRRRLATTAAPEVTMAAPSEVPNADLEAFWSSLLATLPGWELGPCVYRDSGRTRDLVRAAISAPEPEPAPEPQPAIAEGADIFAALARLDALSRPDAEAALQAERAAADSDPLIPLSPTAGVRKSAVKCYEWRRGFTVGATVYPDRFFVYTNYYMHIEVEMDVEQARDVIAKLVK